MSAGGGAECSEPPTPTSAPRSWSSCQTGGYASSAAAWSWPRSPIRCRWSGTPRWTDGQVRHGDRWPVSAATVSYWADRRSKDASGPSGRLATWSSTMHQGTSLSSKRMILRRIAPLPRGRPCAWILRSATSLDPGRESCSSGMFRPTRGGRGESPGTGPVRGAACPILEGPMTTKDADVSAVERPWDPVATTAAEVARELDVDPATGLSAGEAAKRLASNGPNRLTAGKKEPAWRAFLRQYEDFMQVILLGAALVNQLVTQETGTTVVLAGLTVFNAVIGLRQEAKAEESVKALSQMMKTIARVRRDGQAVEIDAGDLVVGDVVLVEAGNRVPADGRVSLAATLEIEEAALTGESLPVGKHIDPVPGDDVPLGDRLCMAYMNTSVTRGRGEIIVTATGMGTEIGHIADMLASTETSKTPLQRQLDSLSKIIASIAAVALVIVVLLGLARGESFDTLFITGVALAVAAIPTGLPAVVTALLSMGTREIARRNAIVKRLPAVETLGSTSAICSDKTGTLTLNKMTARELIIPGH